MNTKRFKRPGQDGLDEMSLFCLGAGEAALAVLEINFCDFWARECDSVVAFGRLSRHA